MEKLSKRKDRFEYTGKLEEYQLMPKKLTMEYEIDKYTSYQNYLYKRALYGLNALTQQELTTMCSKKKKRIERVYLRGQQVINLHKQKLTNQITNLLFNRLFPESPIAQFFTNNSETDDKFKNTLNFKDLNITKDDIICIFIQEGVLPKNFMEISTDPNQLPRLRNASKEKAVLGM
jgi:hypothetical protein